MNAAVSSQLPEYGQKELGEVKGWAKQACTNLLPRSASLWPAGSKASGPPKSLNLSQSRLGKALQWLCLAEDLRFLERAWGSFFQLKQVSARSVPESGRTKLFLRRLALRALAVMLLLVGVKATWGYLEYRSSKEAQFRASFALKETKGGCGKEPGQKLNINLASAEELEKLPGIGKVLAEEILRYRQRHGPFRRAEELMTIRGVGGKKFKHLAPMICAE